MENNKRRLNSAEIRKRKREGIIIALIVLLIAVLTWADVRMSQFSPDLPAGNNILIFGLINVIILLIVLLVYLVFRNIGKLMVDRKSRPFGARLKGKLVLAFVSISLIPTLLLFYASASIINVSIKRWFDKQVETFLEESLDIAKTSYKNAETGTLHFAKQISSVLSESDAVHKLDPEPLREILEKKRKEYDLALVQLFSPDQKEVARAADSGLSSGQWSKPVISDFRSVGDGKELVGPIPEGGGDLIRAMVPVSSSGPDSRLVGILIVKYHAPQSLVRKMETVSAEYAQYRQMKLLKYPIRSGYILTLFLITLMIIFLAIWFGVYLANSLTTPIMELAEATGQVAGGNLDVQLAAEGGDEIGMLVASFNKMTEDLRDKQLELKETNRELTKSNLELDQRRRYMEIVLGSVTAGVISVDRRGILTTVNKSAEKLLNIDTERVLGKHYSEILRAEQLDIIKGLLKDMVLSKKDSISRQVSIPLRYGQLSLLVNLSIMKDDDGEFMGTVVVFDDLTQLTKAQRMAAWREVARRIAHEIKNPLTPIKLSAQRLRKRYLERFEAEEKVFDECTGMIIKSVDEIKTLVDEFSNFARMPAAQPSENDLNEIIAEALTLYREAHRGITFSFVPDESIPPLQLDRDQIKRVLINLFDNAVAALNGKGAIDVESMHNAELGLVTFVVADNGPGISAEDKPRLFEPYFSTKKAGTGLGLAIVNTIISDHNGFIRVKDNVPKGTQFIIELPVAKAWV